MGKQRVTLEITDLGTRRQSAVAVEQSLATTAGVIRAFVNSSTETAYVEFDPCLVTPVALLQAVERAGFRAEPPVYR